MANITKYVHKTLTLAAHVSTSASFAGQRKPGEGYSTFGIRASFVEGPLSNPQDTAYVINMNRDEAERIVSWLQQALEDKAS